MFTMEIRINGSLIAHIYGRNLGTHGPGLCLYHYEYYTPENRGVVTGKVEHARAEGIGRLLQLILKDVETQAKGGDAH